MALTSAWELGSKSCATLLRARSSNFPESVRTMDAPNGRGRELERDRAVKAMVAAICSRSEVEKDEGAGPRGVFGL